jgi:hypothetical protein
MKLSRFALLTPLCLLGFTNACSSGDDDGSGGGAGTSAGTAGSNAGTGGSSAGTSSAGTGGSSAGTGGSSAGTGGSSAGTGGSAGGAGGAGGSSAGTGSSDWPSDTTQAGIDAFIAAMSYKGADWVDNGEPQQTPEHGLVKSWFNKTLRQSTADAQTPRATGSMVVKELYEGTTVVGHAVLLRTATGYIYYCDSSAAGLCYTGHTAGMTVYGTSATSTNCACHGNGTVITPVPPP